MKVEIIRIKLYFIPTFPTSRHLFVCGSYSSILLHKDHVSFDCIQTRKHFRQANRIREG